MKNAQINSENLPVRFDIRILYILSLIIALMVAFVSVFGILYQNIIYPDENLLHSFVPND